MKHSFLHAGVGARVGAIAASLALGATLSLNVTGLSTAYAQQKTDPKAAAPASGSESAWVKLCEHPQVKSKDKDGKEVTKQVDACVTFNELISGENGLPMFSAKLHQMKVDGQEKQTFQLTVPLGAVLPYGVGMTVFPKDLWDKFQKKEKFEKADEEKLKTATVPLTYTFCTQLGCNAEVEANADFLAKLKGGAGFVVRSVHVQTGPVAHPVTLQGFQQALANAPVDTKKYADARAELMKDIYARRQQMIAEMKKQQEDLNKMQPNVAPDKKADPKKK